MASLLACILDYCARLATDTVNSKPALSSGKRSRVGKAGL